MRLLILLILAFPLWAQAGYYELGFSGTYRKLHLPTNTSQDSFDATTSYTGSLAYYFAEMAAAELSLTQGKSERYIPSATADSRTTYDFNLIGFDLVFTFAERKDPFIPYLKAGVAYFARKEVTYEFAGQPTTTVPLPQSFVPSGGFGLKVRLTQALAFKIGLEGWTSGTSNKNRWDLAGRAGISWFL